MWKRWMFAGVLLLIALSAAQLAWHAALNTDFALIRWARGWYQYCPSAEHRKAPVESFLDLLLPAIVSGVLFGRFAWPTGVMAVVIFSVVSGALLSTLQLAYLHIVTPPDRWISLDVWDLVFDATLAGAFTFVAAVGYLSRGQTHTNEETKEMRN